MTGGQLSAGAAGETLAEQCPGSELSQHQGQDERTWTGQGDHQRNPQRHLKEGGVDPTEAGRGGAQPEFSRHGDCLSPWVSPEQGLQGQEPWGHRQGAWAQVRAPTHGLGGSLTSTRVTLGLRVPICQVRQILLNCPSVPPACPSAVLSWGSSGFQGGRGFCKLGEHQAGGGLEEQPHSGMQHSWNLMWVTI
ncbi:unnamed protein product [Rangifer tarandus platyrhynchus]|uniref:Uncharacterized protein n=1 Tax=Rangifer tarandus platyrhynchus TaxID=3082113 RepID=A0AC59Z6S2_RANTA